MKTVLTVLCMTMISIQSLAKGLDGDTWLGALNLSMGSHKVDDSGYEATFYDVTVGYVRPKGIYLGGLFGSGTFGEDKFSHMGASLGYALNGWGLLAHYLLGGTYDSSGTKYTDGTGTQFDLGYMFKTSSPIFVGLQYTTRDMTYKSKTSADLKVNDTYFALKFVYPF